MEGRKRTQPQGGNKVKQQQKKWDKTVVKREVVGNQSKYIDLYIKIDKSKSPDNVKLSNNNSTQETCQIY